MTELSLFKLEPVVPEGDPRWADATFHGPVLVRARSPADARVVASEAEPDFLDIGAKPSHGVSTRFVSAFRDDHLYSVVELSGLDHLREGPRGVVGGNVRSDVIKPLQDRD